ncbi:lantibiotic dehydratase [Streptomyces sp. NBC_00525]|uniref:lantibiotic dehydratase n=1 Tax=Streptomyces sp. NBC_00525 TaxID=2903660 RepID=UPI002E7FD356|nr:lantibiotic dehydratase [Streptomyces sp. NBC_00525]WUC96730.1 lantibiotic dehydratase [Streptomyces sp. NBC_00525]
MYRYVDASLIRLSMVPFDAPALDRPGEEAGTEKARAWIQDVWADDARAAAIGHASPLLAHAVRDVLAGKPTTPRRLHRIGRSLSRYLLRMRYRATPFGLFAGPTVARIGQEAHVRWGPLPRATAHADAVWLHSITSALENDPAVLRCLTVVADPTHVVRGSRITVMNQPGEGGPTDTGLRRTRAAETALWLARTPILVRDLVAGLGAEYPEAAVEDMIRTLVKHRVLLTGLQAPMTAPDALGYLIVRIDESGAEAQAADRLRDVHRVLSHHNRARPTEQPGLRAQATDVMTTISGVAGQSLVVTMRPDADVVLPEAVAREAVRALSLMARITPYPHGSAAWRDYRARFLDRYSTGTAVPVRELTSSDTGLGFPVGYRGTILPRPTLATTSRDEHLLTLAQSAALTDQRGIVLTEDDIEALSVGEPTALPAHVELCFSVFARSLRALTEGRFALSTIGLSLAAGSLTGRFLPMLDTTDRTRMKAAHSTLPPLTEGAVRVQVSAPPLRRHASNVGRAPLVADEVLAVGEYNPDATIALDDLGVVADAERLYLVSLSTGQCLEPSVMSAVELSTATHPLVRFLTEVHRCHTAIPLPFAWGVAAQLPFLPEVRHGRTILSAACWRLRARDLPDTGRWTGDFMDWRFRHRVPRTVFIGSTDQQLRLDLDRAGHRDLLRAELEHHRTLSLHEAPEEDAYGWIGRAHEVTMSFAACQPPAPAPTWHAVVRREDGRTPGTADTAYLKLYGNAERAGEVLSTHLPCLLDDVAAVFRGSFAHEDSSGSAGGVAAPEAWFVRYADPASHLRIRFSLPRPGAFADLAREVGRWADALREEGLIQRVQWDTYVPETGRYGTGPALAAAEDCFAADSAAALAQLRLGLPAELRPAVTAASFMDIATGFLGSPGAAHAWLAEHLIRGDGAAAPRSTQALVLRLTENDNPDAPLSDFPGGGAVRDTWQRRRDALARYRGTLLRPGPAPESVLPSLLHMHHNRVAGIDPDAEALCRRMVRAAALSWSIRTEGAVR